MIVTKVTKFDSWQPQSDVVKNNSDVYLFAPVQTIFPELNISAVVLGSRILMMTAANLYFIK